MLNQRQITKLLSNWNVEKNIDITDLFIAGGAAKPNSTWAIGENYILKTGKNISGLKTHILVSRELEKNGMDSPTPVRTVQNEDYIIEGDRHYILTNRVKGQFLSPKARYDGNRNLIGGKYGEAIENLHNILRPQDGNIEVNNSNLLKTVLDWALPKTKITME